MKSKPIHRPFALCLFVALLLSGCKPSPDVIKAAETRMLDYATELGYKPSGELLKGCTGLPGRYACIVMFKTKLNAKEFAGQVTDLGIPKLTPMSRSGPKIDKRPIFRDFTKTYSQWQHVPNSPFLEADEWGVGNPNSSPFTIFHVEFIELTLVPNSYTWNDKPITNNVVRLEVDFELTASVCSLQENCATIQPTVTSTDVHK